MLFLGALCLPFSFYHYCYFCQNREYTFSTRRKKKNGNTKNQSLDATSIVNPHHCLRFGHNSQAIENILQIPNPISAKILIFLKKTKICLSLSLYLHPHFYTSSPRVKQERPNKKKSTCKKVTTKKKGHDLFYGIRQSRSEPSKLDCLTSSSFFFFLVFSLTWASLLSWIIKTQLHLTCADYISRAAAIITNNTDLSLLHWNHTIHT